MPRAAAAGTSAAVTIADPFSQASIATETTEVKSNCRYGVGGIPGQAVPRQFATAT